MEFGAFFIGPTLGQGTEQAVSDAILREAQLAEQLGFDTVWLAEHHFDASFSTLPSPNLMMAAIAATTSRVKLGTLVTGITYRHPGVLAKIVTTLDVLSGGRAALGLGAAWYEREHRGLGVPFPPLAERFERLEETLQICAQMWDPDNDGPFKGTHYQLAETLCRPQPLQRPRVLIGGGGERKTLRLVARYGDACNLFTTSVEDVARKIEVLRRHCDDLGRDHTEIDVTVTAAFPRPEPDRRDEFISAMDGYARLGVHTVIVTPTSGTPAAWIDAMAPAVRQLAELG